MTAEIGTMKVTEQIDALRSMAADPVKKLVVPKLVATLVMLPALTVIGDALGILGGLIVAILTLNLTPGLYLNDVLDTLTSATSSAASPSPSSSRTSSPSSAATMASTPPAAPTAWAGRRPTPWCSPRILVLVSDFFLTKLFYLLCRLRRDDADVAGSALRDPRPDQALRRPGGPGRPELRHPPRRVPGDPRPLGDRQERDPAAAQRPGEAGRGQRDASTAPT